MTPTDPKTTSLRERIYAIVIQAEVDGLGNKLVSKILLAVKEAMPEKKKDEFFSDVRGWNECREEMEKRCE